MLFLDLGKELDPVMESRKQKRQSGRGADGKDAKYQQSHVRLIKINSFTLHSLSFFLLLNYGAEGMLSKCSLKKIILPHNNHTWQGS